MLSNHSRLVVPAILGLFLAMADGANAGLITYTITETSSGSLGADAYADAQVTLTFVGDTSNVVNVETGVFYNSLGTATVTIEGLGTATFTEPVTVYSDHSFLLGSFGYPSIGFYNGTSYSAIQLSGGITNLIAPEYATYDLTTSFSPVAGSVFNSFVPGGYATDRGTFVLNPASGTFSASASVSAVPEPASLMMFGTGAVGLIGYVRRRRWTTGA